MSTNNSSGVTNVAIIGFGLLGASFGLALNGVPGIRRLCCTRNAAAREWALAEHAAGSEEAFVQQMNDKAEALGLRSDVIDGALRLGFSRYTTEADIQALAEGLKEARSLAHR